MDLRTLIPDVEAVTGPILGVVGDGSGGLSGLVAQVEGQDLGGMASAVGGQLQTELTARLPAAGGGPVAGAVGSLRSFSSGASAPPADLLSGVSEPLSELDGVVTRVPELLEGLRDIAEAIESARTGDLGPVVETVGQAIGEVAERAAGTDLAAFESWTAYLEGLADEIRPIVDAGGTTEEIRDALFAFAVSRVVAAIQGVAPGVADLLDGLAGTVDGLLPDVPALGIPALRDATLAELQAVRAAAESGTDDVAAAVDTYRTRLRTLTDTLHGILDTLEAAFSSPLLTPGGAFTAVEEEIDRALSLQIQDFTDVEARIDEIFASIEEAVDAVDTSVVTGPITDFFTSVQDAVTVVDADAVRGELDGIFGRVDELVGRFESLMTALTARIQEWLGEVADELTGLLDGVGTANPDGTFTFVFEAELDALYARIDAFIQGDPARPDDMSVKKALDDLTGGLEELIATVEEGLAGLAGQLIAARDQVAGSLEGVRTELEGVDPQAVMEQAKAGLESAFEEIGGLEFDGVVDPIVEELEKVRDDLAAIDTSELNDMLRAALKTALDAISTSNFDREITRPLLQEFDELLEEPKSVLRGFADKLNELLARVAAISPESLLSPVQEQIDGMLRVLDVDLEKLLEPPLKEAMRRVRRELEALDPGALLGPLVDAFDEVEAVVDAIEPERLLEPAQNQIDALADRIRDVDLDELVRPVNQVFGDVDRFLEQISPERLVRPLSEPFDLVERSLERFRPSTLLAPVADIMDQIGDVTVDVPDAITDQIRSLYDDALARVDQLDPTAVLGQVSAGVQGLRDRLASLEPEAVVHALQTEFDRVRGAVQLADARDGTSVVLTFDGLAPTLALAGVIGRFQRSRSRLTAVLGGLDPAPLAARFAEARARLDELLPRAIRDDITPARLQTLIGLIDPAAWMGRLDAVFDRILGKVAAFDPATLIAPLQGAWDSLRATLQAIDIGALTLRVEEVFDRIADAVGSLSLTAILEPLTRTLDPLKAAVRALDPSRLADALRERYEGLLDLLEDVAVDDVIDALQAAWDRLSGRIEELFDLDTILEPLTVIFERIGEILGGLDMGELVGVLEEKLDKLRDELEEALNRVGDAFKQMLAAVPLDGGGAGASAGVSI